MSVKTIVFCDHCNDGQSMETAKGWLEGQTEKSAIADFGWERLADGKIICIDCLEG